MIATFTDFGIAGPYLGQVRAAIAALAPKVPVIDLFPDLPAFDIRASAYLIPAYSELLPADSVCLCVVDPGVGGQRKALAMYADHRWYVGPDNGLLSQVARRATRLEVYEITWQPDKLSSSFHGRDLFAPVCAMLASGQGLPAHAQLPAANLVNGWPEQLWEVVYIDGYGNCVTGVRAAALADDSALTINDVICRRQRTFRDSPAGTLFWYENSSGLVEIAMTDGNAAQRYRISVGSGLTRGVD